LVPLWFQYDVSNVPRRRVFDDCTVMDVLDSNSMVNKFCWIRWKTVLCECDPTSLVLSLRLPAKCNYFRNNTKISKNFQARHHSRISWCLYRKIKSVSGRKNKHAKTTHDGRLRIYRYNQYLHRLLRSAKSKNAIFILSLFRDYFVVFPISRPCRRPRAEYKTSTGSVSIKGPVRFRNVKRKVVVVVERTRRVKRALSFAEKIKIAGETK